MGKAKNHAVGGANLRADPRTDVAGTKGGPPRQHQEWPGETESMRPVPDHGENSYRGSGKLSGKTALVTGGDSGIGRAVAIAFAREGADVAIAYFSEHADATDTVGWVERAGRRGIALPCDLSDPADCRRIVAETISAFGRLDILVNNAAVQAEVGDFSQLTSQQIEHTFRVNILAYMYVAQAALAHMPPGSTIINSGSVTALEGHAGLLDYSVTKGAIHTFTKSLALAVAERGIRVNGVAPGPVWTPLIPATLTPEHVEQFGKTTAWQRPAQPAEIAPSYVFFASSDSRYYTGEILAPTGRATTR